jgi:hypothetical protein
VANAAQAAALVGALLPTERDPDAGDDDAVKSAREALAELLEEAQPRRVALLADPALDKGGFIAGDHQAVAVLLAAPDKLQPAALEQGLTRYLAGLLVSGHQVPLSFAGGGGGGRAGGDDGARVLRVPLLSAPGEYAITVSRSGDGGRLLLVATDERTHRRLEQSLRSGLESLLRDDAPELLRADLRRGAAYYKKVVKLLTANSGRWGDSDHSRFFGDSLRGVLDATRDTGQLLLIGYASGPFDVEEVWYRD